MTKRSHVKSGKDLTQEKPAVDQGYSDRDSYRSFKRIKLDVLDGSGKLPPHSANGSRNDFERAGIFKMCEIEDVLVLYFDKGWCLT